MTAIKVLICHALTEN